MIYPDKVIEKDLQHIWHPCSIMKDFEHFPPLFITSAQGSYITTNQGTLIDGISSWWCKSLGHGHPAVIAAIRAQLDQFEHVMPANTTHPTIVSLAEKLTTISQKQHIYFASDGSSAVEIAIKLAIQATALKGQPTRNHLIALSNGYHGETLGALSVTDMGEYTDAWSSFGFPCHFLKNIPYVCDSTDPLWQSIDTIWPTILAQLEPLKHKACALILEPMIQGAGGLRPYSADFLSRLAAYAKQNDIYLISDEIMTGLGRTGEWLAADHAGVQADFICLSKGITSGTLPLSCVLIDHEIYDLFYNLQDRKQAFLHSHTYSGNPLAVAAAWATIHTMQTENTNQQARALGTYMRRCFQEVLAHTGQFTKVRSLGAIVAADFQGNLSRPFSQSLAKAAQERGALLRPMGNTLYWLPPLNTSFHTIDRLAEITDQAIIAVLTEHPTCTA